MHPTTSRITSDLLRTPPRAFSQEVRRDHRNGADQLRTLQGFLPDAYAYSHYERGMLFPDNTEEGVALISTIPFETLPRVQLNTDPRDTDHNTRVVLCAAFKLSDLVYSAMPFSGGGACTEEATSRYTAALNVHPTVPLTIHGAGLIVSLAPVPSSP
eukprot:1196434-Prorocentrum_minimum.AAC.2